MNAAQKALLEKRDGWDVGRDPRQDEPRGVDRRRAQADEPAQGAARCAASTAAPISRAKCGCAPPLLARAGRSGWARTRGARSASEAQREARRKAGAQNGPRRQKQLR